MPRRFSNDEAVDFMRTAGALPLEPYLHANAKWLCKCLRCNREITPRLGSVRFGKDPCIYCSGNKWAPEEAEQVLKLAGFEPSEKFPGRKSDWWAARCVRCNQDTKVTLSSVLNGQTKCTMCSTRTIDWDKANAALTEQLLEPLEPYPGNNKEKWKCRCTGCGSIVFPKLNNVLNGWGGCKPCGYKKVSEALANDSESCTSLMLSKGLNPQVPYPGSKARWKCICQVCERTVYPTYLNVSQGHMGCRYCASRSGYTIKSDGPAIIYLITHSIFNAHKVGFARVGTSRLKQHQRQGWEVYKTLVLPSAAEALDVEVRVLTWIRNELGLAPVLTAAEMPQLGFTETFSADEIDLLTVWRRVLRASGKVLRNP
jgi:formylmethanofuran dehydrogenase subunit E